MMRAYSETRSSPQDLAITFEVNGESAVIYIPADALQTTSKTQLAESMTNPVMCSLCCAKKSGFAACMARCLYGDGRCCDSGATNCE